MPAKKGKSKNDEILKRLSSIEKKQDRILKSQKTILMKENLIEADEKEEISLQRKEILEENKVDSEEIEELDELKKLEALENQIEREVKVNPLKKITQRDVIKGMLGALFGVVGHFAFAEGVDIAEHYTYTRSAFLLITSFIIIVLFLYFAGFRKVDDTFIFKILPIRAIVIYCSALVTVVIVLLLFGKITFATDFHTIFNTVAAISVLAVLGAGTADLLGKNE